MQTSCLQAKVASRIDLCRSPTRVFVGLKQKEARTDVAQVHGRDCARTELRTIVARPPALGNHQSEAHEGFCPLRVDIDRLRKDGWHCSFACVGWMGSWAMRAVASAGENDSRVDEFSWERKPLVAPHFFAAPKTLNTKLVAVPSNVIP